MRVEIGDESYNCQGGDGSHCAADTPRFGGGRQASRRSTSENGPRSTLPRVPDSNPAASPTASLQTLSSNSRALPRDLAATLAWVARSDGVAIRGLVPPLPLSDGVCGALPSSRLRRFVPDHPPSTSAEAGARVVRNRAAHQEGLEHGSGGTEAAASGRRTSECRDERQRSSDETQEGVGRAGGLGSA